MSKEWIIQAPQDGCAQAAARWKLPPIVAQILLNRGVMSDAAAALFLKPQMTNLIDPARLPGAVAAAEVICDAVRAGKNIVLYGDYDVDGITGTAILWHTLQLAGAKVTFYVPHRVEEGYGLNVEAARALVDDGADLIISVDCGITSVDVAKVVTERGAKLVVTDHHQPGEKSPACEAIVHPTAGRPAGDGDVTANPDLCGAGVAFKLAWAIARNMTGAERVSEKYRSMLTDALPLAALGTIADVVPLMGENRVIARYGLRSMRACKLPGLQMLLESAGLADSGVDGTDVGFKLAPRLNAAGRMGHARLAVELLTRADAARAREIAMYLEDHNKARQAAERRISKQAREMVEQQGLDGDANRAIVLASEKWHPGVIGIVASRIVDRYHKPTVLIALENGTGQGSARSVPHFELHTALRKCDRHLISHGGHAMAAGLKIKADAVADFTEAFGREAANALSGSSSRPRLRIDGEVLLSDLDARTVLTLRDLGPFGAGNPRPILATDWLELAAEPRCVGKTGDHVQLSVRQNGSVMKAIAFRAADRVDAIKDHRRFRVAFEPIINEFQGRRSVELQVVDFKLPT